MHPNPSIQNSQQKSQSTLAPLPSPPLHHYSDAAPGPLPHPRTFRSPESGLQFLLTYWTEYTEKLS